MPPINKKYASARMKTNNPMFNAETRAKVSASLKAINHKPPQRGGNGTGLTVPQQLLKDALGNEWKAEYTIPTKRPRGTGYPSNYKIDLALPMAKVAIEIDGNSHKALSRREQDKKKTALLCGMNWTVLRFTNQEVMEDLKRCEAIVASTILNLKDGILTQQKSHLHPKDESG